MKENHVRTDTEVGRKMPSRKRPRQGHFGNYAYTHDFCVKG